MNTSFLENENVVVNVCDNLIVEKYANTIKGYQYDRLDLLLDLQHVSPARACDLLNSWVDAAKLELQSIRI